MSELASLHNVPHDSLFDISLDLHDVLESGLPPEQQDRSRYIPNMSAMSPSYLIKSLSTSFIDPKVWAAVQFDEELERPKAYSLAVLKPSVVKIKTERFSRTQVYVQGLAFDMWSSNDDEDDFRSLVKVAQGVGKLIFPGMPALSIEAAEPTLCSQIIREVLPYEIFTGYMKRLDGNGRSAKWQNATLLSNNPFILD